MPAIVDEMAGNAVLADPAAPSGGTSPPWQAELFALKRKVYTAYLTLASIAVTLVVVFPVAEFEPRAQQLTNVLVPLWLGVAVVAIAAMQRRPRNVVWVERMLYVSAYPLFVGTGAALVFTGEDPARQMEYVHSTAQWLPVGYVWAFVAFGTRRGVLAAGALLVAFVVTVTLGAAFGPHGDELATALPAGALFLASSAVLVLAMYVMWTFVELQTRGRAAAETMARFATVDSLTGLPNRRALEGRLEHDLKVARRERRVLAAYFVDLDDLKGVNDTYGHRGGDELITQYAARLQATVRAADVVARISGDEFVVAGFVGGANDAAALARKLLDATAEPFRIAGDHEVEVGASIGLSLYPDHAEDVAGLLRKADVAMYAAKLSGKNRWRTASGAGADEAGALVTRTGGGGSDADVVFRA